MTLKLLTFFSICALALGLGSTAFAKSDKHKIHQLSPKQISNHIESTTGQRRIIMIYASWCPYCIKKMPKIMDLERTKAGSVIAISVDENYKNLARYIKKFKEVPFRIILNNGSDWALAQKLKKFNIEEWDGVPEIILLDENNKSVGQGNYKIDAVADFLFKGTL